MTRRDNPLARDKQDFRRLAARAAEIAAGHLDSIDRLPVERPVPPAERRLLAEQALPETGLSADEILDFLRDHVAVWPLPTGHRRSYGWINSPPAPIGILADGIATTVNATGDGFDHSGIFLLAAVSRWLMQLLGFPEEGSLGLLLSGGSAANLNALAVARFRAARRAGWDLRRQGLQGPGRPMVVYASDQAHSSIQKSVEMLGLGSDHLRAVPTDEAFRMRGDALVAMIDEDLSRDIIPCCVVASGGATNCGAIDPLSEIAEITVARGIWLHVDGAYGAIGRLDPAYEERFRGMERADSLTFNPHKWLMTPVDCGALLVRDKQLQREAFSLVPAYLAEGGSDQAPWPFEYSFQLTYANRAVKTWATLARLGRSGLRDLVVRLNALADSLGALIDRADDLERLAPVSLSIVCFRYRPLEAALDEAAIDRLNEEISARIGRGGEAHLPTTKIGGRPALRVCFMHYENDQDDVGHILALVRNSAQQILADRLDPSG